MRKRVPRHGRNRFFGDNELGVDHLELTVIADAHGNNFPENPSASAAIDLTFFATTAGPVRPGIAEFGVAASGDGSLVGIKTRNSTASIEGLGSCTIEFPVCLKQSPEGGVPFTLGMPFQIKLTAEVEYVGGEPSGFNTDGSIQLSLFELIDGVLVPVTILGPVAVPEPNQFIPALLFASAGILWNLRARKAPGKV